jgi:hypothetical protein
VPDDDATPDDATSDAAADGAGAGVPPLLPPMPPGASAIAEWGLASAAAVVERMLELGRSGATGLRLDFPVNGAAPGPLDGAPAAEAAADATEPTDPAERAKQARRFRADAERLVELYAEWTRMLVDGAASLAEQAAGISPSAGSPEGEPAPSALVLGPASAGATTTTSAWLHVLDGPAAAPAALHATALVAHDGAAVPGSACTCTPAVLETSAARTTSEIRVSVRVPDGTRPGTYHGHLLADGLPEVALALRLEVVA